MKLDQITPVILTLNEAPNIGRCLERLQWATEVIVLDSGSSDETLSICARYANVRVEHRDFDSHSAQWNHATSLAGTPWVLALDADFMLSDRAVEEFAALPEESEINGYVSRFRYCVNGRPLRSSLYPPKTVLFQKDSCTYVQDGHTQLLTGDTPSRELSAVIDHDDRKPLAHWLKAQHRYAVLEVDKLLHGDRSEFGLPDKIRCLICPAAPVVLFYTLFVRGTLFDGWPGIFYALQRTYAELLVSLELLDAKLRDKKSDSPKDEHHSEPAPPLSRPSRLAHRRSTSLHD